MARQTYIIKHPGASVKFPSLKKAKEAFNRDHCERWGCKIRKAPKRKGGK